MTTFERGLGSNDGHQFALTITEGGNGQSLAGHGVMNVISTNLGNGQYISPSGTTVVTPRPGINIADSTGQILENITSVENLDSVLKSGIAPDGRILTPRNIFDLTDYNVVLPGQQGYNYTLLSPGFQNKPLSIFSNSTTASEPTQLSNFLEKIWAAFFGQLAHKLCHI
jgi:filamentous hemagglutinin